VLRALQRWLLPPCPLACPACRAHYAYLYLSGFT
jgi:hypothetical protein